MKNHRSLTAMLMAALAATSACAVDDVAPADDADALIGGQPVDSPALDAIGALVADPDGDGDFEPFCTGTLIAPTLVLTSDSCARRHPADQVGFAVGPDAAAPRIQVAALGAVVEDTVAGGILGLGVDVGVVHLRQPVPGVTPLPIARLGAEQTGQVFVGHGYGVRDRHRRSGTRRSGSMQLEGTSGRVLELIFGSFHRFVDDGARHLFPHLDPRRDADRRRLRDQYDRIRLLDGNEAWLGDGRGDAQACAGDGGGPLTRKVGGVDTVFGVASWAFASCQFGTAYAAMSQPALDLVAYQTACPLLPREGTCEGDVAVRCATPAEGGHRILRTDCGDLGLACGVDDAGQLACVDPCQGLADGGHCDGDVAVRCSLPNEGSRRVLRTDCADLVLTCGTDASGAVACIDSL